MNQKQDTASTDVRRGPVAKLLGLAFILGVLAAGAWVLHTWLESYRTRMQYVGYPVFDFALPDLHAPERIVRAADLRGEPYLLHTFASWCPACAAGHAETARTAQRYRLRLVGYNLEDERDLALDWLQRKGDPYARIVADRDGEIALLGLRMYATPHFVLVDADGIIRWRHSGNLDSSAIELGLEPALREMGHTP